MKKDLRRLKKDTEFDIIIKPHISILKNGLVEVISEQEDKITLKVKKDVDILGSKNKDNCFKIKHMRSACRSRHSVAITPREEMSLRLREENYPIISVSKGGEALHYKDELCIPYNTDDRDGKFYIIKNEKMQKYT